LKKRKNEGGKRVKGLHTARRGRNKASGKGGEGVTFELFCLLVLKKRQEKKETSQRNGGGFSKTNASSWGGMSKGHGKRKDT